MLVKHQATSLWEVDLHRAWSSRWGTSKEVILGVVKTCGLEGSNLLIGNLDNGRSGVMTFLLAGLSVEQKLNTKGL